MTGDSTTVRCKAVTREAAAGCLVCMHGSLVRGWGVNGIVRQVILDMPLRSNSLQRQVGKQAEQGASCVAMYYYWSWRDKEGCLRNIPQMMPPISSPASSTAIIIVVSLRLCAARERRAVCNLTLSLTPSQAGQSSKTSSKTRRAGHLHGSAATRGCHFAVLGADCRAAARKCLF